MTLVVVGSVAGSPGATSLAIGLAATWPDPGRRRVVVEADPDGGRLGAELGVGVEPGLMALALAARTTTALMPDDLVERGAAGVADWSVIPAPASSEQTHSALVHAAGSLAGVMARRSRRPGVDRRRRPALDALAVAAVRHRRRPRASSSRPAPSPRCNWCPTASRRCAPPAVASSVVVVQPTSWSTEEIAQFVTADVLVVLPRVRVARRRPVGDAVERLASVVEPGRAGRALPRLPPPSSRGGGAHVTHRRRVARGGHRGRAGGAGQRRGRR